MKRGEIKVRFKTFLQLLIILGIVGTFGYHGMWGRRGLIRFYALKKDVDAQKKVVAKLEQHVQTLQQKVDSWQDNDFEREKVVREDLQMGFTNEYVYVLPKE